MRRSKSRFIEDARRVGTGAVRKPHLPFSRLVGTVSNSADAVRLETAPTHSLHERLFLGFTIHRESCLKLSSTESVADFTCQKLLLLRCYLLK